jgi:hypothetical protein
MSLQKTTHTLFAKFSGREKIFFLFLTILTGIFLIWPLHNFQNYLSQGDHGRDLYCFKKTMEGAVPYRDYSWLFGPLMPYYYSIFYALGGVSIQSILLGQLLLILCVGVLVYLICSVYLSPALSFVCALWYWAYRDTEFFYTYNHIGGLAALLVAIYCVLRYIRDNRTTPVYIGFISLFLLMLIRLNMGAAALTAYVVCLCLIDFIQDRPTARPKRRAYIILSLAVLTATALVYWYLLHPLPDYVIRQSFPYGKLQRTDYSPSLFHTLSYTLYLIASYITATPAQLILGNIFLFSILQTFILLRSDKFPRLLKRNTLLALVSFFIFLVLCSHEFVASGVFYRLYWIFPLIYVILFYFIATATRNLTSPVIKFLILATFVLPPFLHQIYVYQKIRVFKNPEHLLHIGRNKIYTLQKPEWFKTVGAATEFLKEHVADDETVLVLPLDPLYLFLSEKDSATRQLVFFDHINISREQEASIIKEMESKNGNWAVISNRANTAEPGMGIFGQTYCAGLARYLYEHFAPVARFGDWTNPPGWAWDHGVVILKRTSR